MASEAAIVFASWVAWRGPMSSDQIKSRPKKPRCEICNGCFGLIRHRFAHKQFCSKRCLGQYLAVSKQRPSSLKQWLDFSRTVAEHPTIAIAFGGALALVIIIAIREHFSGRPF